MREGANALILSTRAMNLLIFVAGLMASLKAVLMILTALSKASGLSLLAAHQMHAHVKPQYCSFAAL